MQTTIDTQALSTTLHAHGMRLSDAKVQVFAILGDSPEPLTIQEVVERSKDLHFVSIYRAIDSLLKAALITQVPIGFKNKYELSDSFKPHHHHVTCEQCGKSFSVQSEEVEKLMDQLTLKAGLQPTHHHLEAYGICTVCSSLAC